jgi:hypothetical protein
MLLEVTLFTNVKIKEALGAMKPFSVQMSENMPNKSLKVVPRCARHWTASNSAFASQIVRAVSSRPLALR